MTSDKTGHRRLNARVGRDSHLDLSSIIAQTLAYIDTRVCVVVLIVRLMLARYGRNYTLHNENAILLE